jgi:hypothetical protein
VTPGDKVALYPHGGWREWSTSHRGDLWKLPLVEFYVPAEALKRALALVDGLVDQQAMADDWWVKDYDKLVAILNAPSEEES